MARSVASESLKRDRMLRWLYYRPYIVAGALFLFITLAVSVLAGKMWLRREKEWEGAALQEVEVTCLALLPEK